MKKFLLSTFVAASTFVTAQSHALELEIAPLNPSIKAEVLGMRFAADASGLTKDAIVFTGAAARTVARGAGVAIDTSKQMIVATGSEVGQILNKTARFSLKAGEIAFVQTSKFAKNSVNLVLDVAQNGGRLLVNATRNGTKLVAGILADATKMTVKVLSDVGEFTFRVTKGVLDTVALTILRLLGIVL